MPEVDTTLMQYGVKGMHWGVITKGANATKTAIKKNISDRKAAAEKEVPVTIKAKSGKPIITKGGKNLPTSEDAKIAAIAKQKAKGTGLQSLSNAEMKVLVDRMGLEERYRKMTPQEITLGMKAAKMIVNSPAPDLAMLAYKVKSEADNAKIPDKKAAQEAQAKVQFGLNVAQTILTSARQNTSKK